MTEDQDSVADEQLSKRSGRPSKYSPERVKTILDAIRIGVPNRWAACRAGISDDTLIRWRRRYADFAVQVAHAEADFVAHNVALVQQAAQFGDAKSAQWLLERRYPEDFGRRDRAGVSVEEVKAQTLALAKQEGFTDEEAAEAVALAERMAKRRG